MGNSIIIQSIFILIFSIIIIGMIISVLLMIMMKIQNMMMMMMIKMMMSISSSLWRFTARHVTFSIPHLSRHFQLVATAAASSTNVS
jgi:hypothetical protein